jgi:hypothetical protein
MSRKPDPELHAVWRKRVERQARSGLTIAQFCTRERLSVGSFSNWKRRFRLVDLAPPPPAAPASAAFLPVTVRVVEHAACAAPIEAELPNGIRLRIPTADARLACRVLRAVARAQTRSGGTP